MSPFPYLRPGGDGLYTVHTKKELKTPIQQAFYQTSDELEIAESWIKQWSEVGTRPTILGIPSDIGGSIHRGANWGPLFLRKQLIPLVNHFVDAGDILVVPQLLDDQMLNQQTIEQVRMAIYGKTLDLPVSPLSMLKHFTAFYFSHFQAPLLSLGGDHSISAPIIGQLLKNSPDLAVIHFDAHTDLLYQRLGITHCFATWAQEIANQINNPDRFIQLGVRASGKPKDYWEDEFPITQHWAQEISKADAADFAKKIVRQIEDSGATSLYLSFDIDVIDAKECWSSGTPEANGLSVSWIEQFLNVLSQRSLPIKGIDIVEFAPFVNFEQTIESPTISYQNIQRITTLLATLLLAHQKMESELCR